MAIIGEKTAINFYKATENFTLTNFKKISDKATKKFFGRDNETLEETKMRLKKI